ncbi:MAG: hypothetical protein GXY17_01920 [Clostridiaceae bacterium]|jgi:hypothetical protein|nr:hypothetical protein [Clostridiaceae bacterium]
MIADGTYDNGLITFPRTENRDKLDTYCRTEGVDYQHLLSQIGRRQMLFSKLPFPGRKGVKNKDKFEGTGRN